MLQGTLTTLLPHPLPDYHFPPPPHHHPVYRTSRPASPATAINEDADNSIQAKEIPRECLRSAQCGPVADAHLASTDGGFMQHMGQNHGGQVLLADCGSTALAQSQGLRLLWHCQITAVSPTNTAEATLLCANFALGTPSRTDDSPGIRSQRPAVRQPVNNSIRTRSQYLQQTIWTTARFRTALPGTSV